MSRRETHPTSFRLTAEMRAALSRECVKRRWSMARMIEYIVEQWVEKQRKAAKREEPKQ